jgi:hypothetical protein
MFGPVDELRYQLGVLLWELAMGAPDLGITPGLADLLGQPTNLFACHGGRRQRPDSLMGQYSAQLLQLAPQGDARR